MKNFEHGKAGEHHALEAAVLEFERGDDQRGPLAAEVAFLISMCGREPDGTYRALAGFGRYELDYLAAMVADLRPEALDRDELNTLFEFQAGLFREMRKRP